MQNKIIKGFKDRNKAYRASRTVNTNPSVVSIDIDNETYYYGVGEIVLTPSGDLKQYVYGARGKTCTYEDFQGIKLWNTR